MKILITGAAGFLAKFVIDRLHKKHDLTLFDCVEMKTEARFIHRDITNYEDVKRACEGQNAVIHLVALVRGREDKPHGTFADVMVKGTWNVAQACATSDVKKVINISSIAAAGAPDRRERCYSASDHCGFHAQDAFYAISKYLGEEVLKAYHEAHGLSVINLRPGVIAGDGANGEPTAPMGKSPPFWFVYVHPEDVAQAVERAIDQNNVNYGTFCIVAGRSDSLFDWREAAETLGYAPEHNWEEIQ